MSEPTPTDRLGWTFSFADGSEHTASGPEVDALVALASDAAQRKKEVRVMQRAVVNLQLRELAADV